MLPATSRRPARLALSILCLALAACLFGAPAAASPQPYTDNSPEANARAIRAA